MPDLVPHVLPAGRLGSAPQPVLPAVGNAASCRVAAKSGFALEGTKRSSLLHDDGWHDMHLHGRVSPS